MNERVSAARKYQCIGSEGGGRHGRVYRRCILLVCLVIVLGSGRIETSGMEKQQRRIEMCYRSTRKAQAKFLKNLEERLKSPGKSKQSVFESWPVVNNILDFDQVHQLVPYEDDKDIRDKFYRLVPEARDIEAHTQITASSEATNLDEAVETQPKSIDESISDYVRKQCNTEQLGNRRFTHCTLFTTINQKIDDQTTAKIEKHIEELQSGGSFVTFIGMYPKADLKSGYLKHYEKMFGRAEYRNKLVESVNKVCRLVHRIGDAEARNIFVCCKPTSLVFHTLMSQIQSKGGLKNTLLFILFCEEFVRIAAAEEVALRNRYASSEEMFRRIRQESNSSNANAMGSTSNPKMTTRKRNQLNDALRKKYQDPKRNFESRYIDDSEKLELMFRIFKHRVLIDCEISESIANKKAQKRTLEESTSATAAKVAKPSKPEDAAPAEHASCLQDTLISSSRTAQAKVPQAQCRGEPVQQKAPGIQSTQTAGNFDQATESTWEDYTDMLKDCYGEYLFTPAEMLAAELEHQDTYQIMIPEPEYQGAHETEDPEFEWYRDCIWE